MREIDDLREQLKTEGVALIHYDDGPVHSFPYDAPWLVDETFTRVYEAVRHNTLVDRPRCYSIFLLMQQMIDVPGDILEVGTWRGGTAGILASSAPSRTVFVADTFQGVVKSSHWEHYQDSAHSDTSERLVRDFFAGLGLSNTQVLAGVFPEETGSEVADRVWSLVHLDVDVYESVRDAFLFVWEQVAEGGVVLLDDYGFTSACSGVKRFVDGIWADSDKLIVTNLNGQVCIIKRRVRLAV